MEELPWKACINDYLLNYRNIPHSMTGVTPNELMGLEDNSSMDSLPTIIKPNHDSKSKTAMKEYTKIQAQEFLELEFLSQL